MRCFFHPAPSYRRAKLEYKAVRDDPAWETVPPRSDGGDRIHRIFTSPAAAITPAACPILNQYAGWQKEKARAARSIERRRPGRGGGNHGTAGPGLAKQVAGVTIEPHLVPWTCAYVLDRCTVVLPARCRGRAKRSEAARSRPSLAAARCHPGSTGVADAREPMCARKRDRPTTRGTPRCFCKRGGDV